MINNIVNDFYRTFQSSESFSEGAAKLAKLFVRSEETVEPGALLDLLLQKAPNPKIFEYLLFSFLDTRESDFDVIQYSIRFKRLKRLFGNILNNSPAMNSDAYHMYNMINMVCKMSSPHEISLASSVMSLWLQKLKSGMPLGDREYMQLSLLIKGEATALKLQSDYVSSTADAYNMKKMIRLLPLVSSADELSQRLLETAEKLSQKRTIGEPVLSFEYALKPDQFQKWLKKISKEQSIATFIDTLRFQRDKMIPTSRLIAVTSLIRQVYENKGTPLQWIHFALDCSTKNGFKINAGDSLQKMRAVIQDNGIIANESYLYGNFNTLTLSNFIGVDRLSKVLDSKKDLSTQDLVTMGMRNDTLMCRLLDNPKIYNVPRLVEYVAKTSRSIVVLSKISSTRELHTGVINNGVPLALLTNPTHLPLNMLRQFINPRYISLNEMRFLIRSPYGLRQDVFNEIKSFIERKK